MYFYIYVFAIFFFCQDCGALRAAHAGMALSDAEASIVSPFTGKSKSVRCVVDMLLEGRATLHTSFAMYKYLVCNGLILSLTKQAIFYYGVLLCIFSYMMIDLVATLGLGYFMVLALPPKRLQVWYTPADMCAHYCALLLLTVETRANAICVSQLL